MESDTEIGIRENGTCNTILDDGTDQAYLSGQRFWEERDNGTRFG